MLPARQQYRPALAAFQDEMARIVQEERARVQREADAEDDAEDDEEDGRDGKQDEDDGLGLRRAWEGIYDLTGMNEENEDE